MGFRPRVNAPPAHAKQSEQLITEFRSYLNIDKEGLDEAMARQADLYFRIGEACALAISRRDEAKEALNTVDADLGRVLRGAKKGVEEKRTEGAIKDLIQTDAEHQAAYKRYNDARNEAEVLAALRDAFQERGRMLRDLGHLYATGYFTVRSSTGAAADIGREQLRRARSERSVG